MQLHKIEGDLIQFIKTNRAYYNGGKFPIVVRLATDRTSTDDNQLQRFRLDMLRDNYAKGELVADDIYTLSDLLCVLSIGVDGLTWEIHSSRREFLYRGAQR